jgi:hypothetical protein
MRVILDSATYGASVIMYDIRSILEYPFNHEWSTQGFGMLRTYLDKDRKHRMNVWNSALATHRVSTIHDHPWHFTSLIVVGSIYNTRYVECPEWQCGLPYSYAQIKCGPGGGMVQPMGDIDLMPRGAEVYGPRDTYTQRADEIHETHAQDGSVTIISRTFRPDTEHARVFWQRGFQWISAEPRLATDFEIQMATGAALRRMRSENFSRG